MATPGTTTGTAAPGGAFPPFQAETYLSQLLWLALTFGFLYWLTARVVVPRLNGILEDRAARIGRDLDSAAAMTGKANEAGIAHETALAAARASSQAIAQQKRDAVNAASDARRKGVEADLATKLAEAETRIVAMKQAAMANVDAIAADAAEAIVERLTGIAPGADAAAAAVRGVMKG